MATICVRLTGRGPDGTSAFHERTSRLVDDGRKFVLKRLGVQCRLSPLEPRTLKSGIGLEAAGHEVIPRPAPPVRIRQVCGSADRGANPSLSASRQHSAALPADAEGENDRPRNGRYDSAVGADTSQAVRQVIVDHVDALGQDVLQAGLRSIENGDEILLVLPSRLVTIRVTRSPATVTFDVRSLRDATISFETTAVGIVVHQFQSANAGNSGSRMAPGWRSVARPEATRLTNSRPLPARRWSRRAGRSGIGPLRRTGRRAYA
jgi:hypothetical protein